MAKKYTALNKEERVCQYTICVSVDDTNSIASILRTASASNIKFCVAVIKDETISKWYFIFIKSLDFSEVMWYCVVLPEVIKMNVIKELWHGNIIPQEDSRTNSKEMKDLLGYMARHHEDLEKSFSNEQKEIFEKFHDCWSEYMSLAEAAIFEYAFKLGMNIAIETLTDESKNA